LTELTKVPNSPNVVATAFSLRGRAQLPAVVPAGVATRARPAPARLLREAWARTELFDAELFCGRVDVFHGTNFVLPPLRHAAGVVSVHDLSYLRYPETVHANSLRYRELVPRSVRRAAAVCVLTSAMGEEIAAEYAIPADRIHVTAPGVDEAWFAAAPLSAPERAAIGVPQRYLLAVGTLEPRKNLGHLIAAYRELRFSDPDTPPLVLAGQKGWGPELEAAGLPEGSLILPGYLADAQLRGLVAGAACLAYPTLYEGFGLPPVEALACGVPVIASDLPVIREVLGEAATLVPATDLDALSDALRVTLARQPSDAGREAGRAQARRWTWRGCAEATMAAYRAALGS
jgi:glycosyltransferase involved in cell wall biosynthesis